MILYLFRHKSYNIVDINLVFSIPIDQAVSAIGQTPGQGWPQEELPASAMTTPMTTPSQHLAPPIGALAPPTSSSASLSTSTPSSLGALTPASMAPPPLAPPSLADPGYQWRPEYTSVHGHPANNPYARMQSYPEQAKVYCDPAHPNQYNMYQRQQGLG